MKRRSFVFVLMILMVSMSISAMSRNDKKKILGIMKNDYSNAYQFVLEVEKTEGISRYDQAEAWANCITIYNAGVPLYRMVMQDRMGYYMKGGMEAAIQLNFTVGELFNEEVYWIGYLDAIRSALQ